MSLLWRPAPPRVLLRRSTPWPVPDAPRPAWPRTCRSQPARTPLGKLPDKRLGTAPRVLDVDFAFKRCHVYGTILIDMETGKRVDVLASRTVDTLAAWLRGHPGVEIMCRDRASAYAEAVRTACPDATQVADRFHLWKNLCEAVEKCVGQHRTCLAEPTEDATADPPVAKAGTTADEARHRRSSPCARQ
ncbi:transposase [Streptomyces sp. NPDC057686]|uniref:transposase n=1 Tax=Streptomyces sp. NPDC057686 TaxID=3346212 RepID=UPI0036C1A281